MKDINLYKEYFNASLVYRESYWKMVGYEKEEVPEYFDLSPFWNRKGDKMDYSKIAEVLDYHIYQILYTLNESQAIQNYRNVI